MPTEITRNDLDDLVPRLKNALRTAHDYVGQELWGNLRELSPQDHGRLAGSWTLQRLGDMHSLVGTNVVYAVIQNEGSDPFEIFPRNAKALRFEIDGNVIFAKRVSHPGIKGKKYIDESIEKTESRIGEFVEMALEQEGLS